MSFAIESPLRSIAFAVRLRRLLRAKRVGPGIPAGLDASLARRVVDGAIAGSDLRRG
jgi:hypothetical protein